MNKLQKITRFFLYLPDWAVFYITLFLGMFGGAARGWVKYDFANYHFYNPWAFLNGRLDTDIIPNGIHHFLNPLLDLPFFFFVTYFNDNALLVYAMQGIWSGLYLFAAYKLGGLFFAPDKFIGRIALYLFVAFSYTNDMHTVQMGVPTNEVPIGVFCLFGLYLLFYTLKQKTFSGWRLALGGMLIGAAFGLKATAVIWCLSSGTTLILLYKNIPHFWKTIIYFALGGLAGYLLTNGYFLFHYAQLYQNPFFPLFNGIFKSEYYDFVNYSERGFTPNGWEYLYFPYTWLKNPKINEFDYLNKQVIYQYTISIVFIVSLAFTQGRRYWKNHLMETAVQLFWILSFVYWMALFSVIRYFLVGETIASLLLIFYATKLYNVLSAALEKKFPQTPKWFDAKTFYVLICLGLTYNTLEYFINTAILNIKYSQQKTFIYPLKNIYFPENAVINLYNNELSFLIPLLPSKEKNYTFVGHPLNFWKKGRFDEGNTFENFGKFQQLAQQKYAENPDKIYTIINYKYYSDDDAVRNYNTAQKALSDNDACYLITTTLQNERPYICVPQDEVRRILPQAYRPDISATKHGLPLSLVKEDIKSKSYQQNLAACIMTNNCFNFY